MGAIVAVIGQAGDPELAERLERMLARSPRRGAPQRHVEPGLAIGVQNGLRDGSLAVLPDRVVAFHGFVGNWAELGSAIGVGFDAGASNAERVAAAWSAVGDRALPLLRGEFALAVVDRRKRTLLAARDIVGARPLFFAESQGRLFMASEIRQLLAGTGSSPELCERAMARALLLRYVEGETTLYEGVRRVTPGFVYGRGLDGASVGFCGRPYWQPPPERLDCDAPQAELAEELSDRIVRAVGRCLPETPGALGLSGGMDSSSIWAAAALLSRRGDTRAAQLQPVALAYPGLSCDESAYIAANLELGGPPAVVRDASALGPLASLPGLVSKLDEEFGSTLFQVEVLAAMARESGRHTLLLGLGGDEWLSGKAGSLVDELRRGHLRHFFRDACSGPLGAGWHRARAMARIAVAPSVWLGRTLGTPRPPRWLGSRFRDEASASQRRPPGSMSRRELLSILGVSRGANYLGAIEQLGSVVGFELRCPLNDVDVVEFAFAAPARVLLAGARSKPVLRAAMSGLVPAGVLERSDKTSFSELVERDACTVAGRADVGAWRLADRGIVDSRAVQALARRVVERRGYGDAEVFFRLYLCEQVCRTFTR